MLGQPRSTHRHEPLVGDGEQALTNEMVGLATRFGRYGYRRIIALLRRAGWNVPSGCWSNNKRVDRIWRRKGPKVLARQPRKGRLWLDLGSCVRLSRRGETMCGLMTSSRSGPEMGGRCGC